MISFLLATKMLQSARFPYPKGMLPRGEQDVQFSHSRIIDSLRLPATFRSLARPSSALEPSHPPCGVTAVFFACNSTCVQVAYAADRHRAARRRRVLRPGPIPNRFLTSSWGSNVRLPKEFGMGVRERLQWTRWDERNSRRNFASPPRTRGSPAGGPSGRGGI